MLIDGWECTEDYPGYPWRGRTATRRGVEWAADVDGLELRESYGILGACGTYGLPASVATWLTDAVRQQPELRD